MSYLTLEIVEQKTNNANIGDLLLTITPEGLEELKDLQTKRNKTDQDIFIDLLESHLCNGYFLVDPENVGALTDSLLIADGIIDEETKEDEVINVWWFPNYMVKSYIDGFIEKGFVVFTKAD